MPNRASCLQTRGNVRLPICHSKLRRNQQPPLAVLVAPIDAYLIPVPSCIVQPSQLPTFRRPWMEECLPSPRIFCAQLLQYVSAARPKNSERSLQCALDLPGFMSPESRTPKWIATLALVSITAFSMDDITHSPPSTGPVPPISCSSRRRENVAKAEVMALKLEI